MGDSSSRVNFFRSLNRFGLVLIYISLIIFCARPQTAKAFSPFTVILVDKKTNQLHLASYANGEMAIQKTFHTTLGKIVGDKFVTDDKKTPEGVYFILSKRMPPNLQKKFGVMAFPVDYPNPVDRFEKKTGFGIMLHATDDPSRLTKNYDSDGCVVLANQELEEVSKMVHIGFTPLIVYEELKKEMLAENAKPQVKVVFQSWLDAWQGKNIEGYIDAYHPEFKNNGLNLKNYKIFKTSLNKKYERISVKTDHVRYYYHPKYDVITFTQDYESFNGKGQRLFRSEGTKTLYLKTDEKGQPRILHEDFSQIKE